MTRDSARFGKATTADEVLEGVDLSGKVAVVTGASSGLGAEAARAMAARGAALVLGGRQMEKLEGVAQQIRASTNQASIETLEIELTDADSVRSFAEQVRSRHAAIHILMNNAGVMACPLARTAQGYEMQFAANHLGHFLLSCLLAPALQRGAPSRVVSVSSGGHRFSPVVFEDIHFEQRPYDKWAAYGQSKTANILLAVELDRRLAARGVRANAIHPGVIMTELARHLTPQDLQELSESAPAGGLEFKRVEAGAATQVFAATAPELEGKGAHYLEDCKIASINEDETTAKGVRAYALDPDAAVKLWTMSEEMIGETFSI